MYPSLPSYITFKKKKKQLTIIKSLRNDVKKKKMLKRRSVKPNHFRLDKKLQRSVCPKKKKKSFNASFLLLRRSPPRSLEIPKSSSSPINSLQVSFLFFASLLVLFRELFVFMIFTSTVFFFFVVDLKSKRLRNLIGLVLV